MTIARRLAVIAATAVLAACGKDSTGADAAEGSLSFTYTGARVGSYSAQGTVHFRPDNTIVNAAFATGTRFTDANGAYMGIVGYVPASATTGHQIAMLFPTVTSATTVSLGGVNGCAATCSIALLAFDVTPDSVEEFSQIFLFSGGTLNITSVSSDRLRGTFSGTAVSSSGNLSIAITDGTFDVPLVRQQAGALRDRLATAAILSAARLRR